jgi:hypothetical protein
MSRLPRTLIALLLQLLPALAFAQTGGQPLDWDEVAKIPEWEPEPMDYAEAYSVDLRPKFPPVGKQEMNDCTTWSMSAIKAYHEVLDQGWAADRASRTFSPRFLYNQVNDGRDNGSSPINVLNLLKDKGCATLATCPYVPGDFRGRPSFTWL